MFALVFDLALLALLVGGEPGLTQQGLTQLMMLNPADIFRLVNLAGLDGSDVNGALAIAINSSLSQGQLFSTRRHFNDNTPKEKKHCRHQLNIIFFLLSHIILLL
ncbi:MAG: hypothetical protein MJK12_03250 [Colwellia sp.]|nr:hypothetical protein [Colwellia sp.]